MLRGQIEHRDKRRVRKGVCDENVECEEGCLIVCLCTMCEAVNLEYCETGVLFFYSSMLVLCFLFMPSFCFLCSSLFSMTFFLSLDWFLIFPPPPFLASHTFRYEIVNCTSWSLYINDIHTCFTVAVECDVKSCLCLSRR